MLIDPVGTGPGKLDGPGISPAADTATAVAAPRNVGMDETQLRAIVHEAQRAIAPLASSIEFTVDQESGKTVVKVIETETQTLIRQIPSPEILEMAHAIERMQGLLLRQNS